MKSLPHILVVDDEGDIREVICAVLEQEGYNVTTAPHGAAALAAVERSQPDVILLDMKMPVMDGWTFARRYRALPGPKAPLIAVTAAACAAKRAAEIQADGVISKPFDLDELVATVQQHLPEPVAGV